MSSRNLLLPVLAAVGSFTASRNAIAQELVAPVKIISHRREAYTEHADPEVLKRIQTIADAFLFDPNDAFFEAALANGLAMEGANLIGVTEDTTFVYELSYALENRNGSWTVAIANSWSMKCNGRLHRESPGVWLYFQHEYEGREAFAHRIARDLREKLVSVEKTLFNLLEHTTGEDWRNSPAAIAAFAIVFCPHEEQP